MSRPSAAAADQIVMASRLPLRGYRHLPVFLKHTMTIRRQLARADGLIGYALEAHPLAKHFYTVSVWRDRAALNAFAGTNPHRQAVEVTRPNMAESKFEFWTRPASDEPVSWDEAKRRLG